MFGETYTVITTSIILVAIVYRLFLYPINQRCNIAFNDILAKEIARSLYQTINPQFTYANKYRPDDLQSQLILSAAMEEFKRICQQEKEDIR